MNYPHGASAWLGITAEGAALTALGTCIIYLVFLLTTKIFGARLQSGLTTFDTLMTMLFGAVIGRTMIGPVPTLAAGIVVFATLLILHIALGAVTNTARGDRLLNSRPVLLMAGHQILERNLKSVNTTHTELMSALREHGISDKSQVAAVIMESSGKLSVLSAAHPIDREMLEGVKDGQRIPARFIRG